MRAVDVEKQHGRSKSVKAGRAYVCFLEREVYAFLTNVVSGFAAQCCGPAFFVCGRAAENDVRSGRRTGRRWIVGGTRRACGQSNTGGARVGIERKVVFFFLGERLGDIFFTFWVAGAQPSRPWDIGAAAKNDVCADCGTVWKTQLVEG